MKINTMNAYTNRRGESKITIAFDLEALTGIAADHPDAMAQLHNSVSQAINQLHSLKADDE